MLYRICILVGSTIALFLMSLILVSPTNAYVYPHEPDGGIEPPWFAGNPYYRNTHIYDNTSLYGSQLDSAISDWNTQLGNVGSAIGLDTNVYIQGEGIDEWIVRSAYPEDTYLANTFGIPTCYAYSSNPNYNSYYVSSFQQLFDQDPNFFNVYLHSRVCLNYDFYSGAQPTNGYFSQKDPGTQAIGLSHEIGHSLSLDHRTDVSVMNTNWLYPVQFSDGSAVLEWYNK